MEREMAGETWVFAEYKPQRHFIHHKFHIWRDLVSNPGRRGE
jgi:hypothetical protein